MEKYLQLDHVHGLRVDQPVTIRKTKIPAVDGAASSGIMTDEIDLKVRGSDRGTNVMGYWPLLVLLSVSLFVVFFLAEQGVLVGMHHYMGFLLCSSAMVKLLNPEVFAKDFAMYDLGKKVKVWCM